MNGAESQLGHQSSRGIGQLHAPAEEGDAEAIGMENVGRRMR